MSAAAQPGSQHDSQTATEPTAAPIHTISLFVNNKPGVLVRVALVFSRRGFNIESLVVSPAAGIFTPIATLIEGSAIAVGTVVGHVAEVEVRGNRRIESDAIRARMKSAGPGPPGVAQGVAIAREMVEAFMDRVVGVYVMPQLGRYGTALEILQPVGYGQPGELRTC